MDEGRWTCEMAPMRVASRVADDRVRLECLLWSLYVAPPLCPRWRGGGGEEEFWTWW